ncbi:hypothetical protein HDK64DRAFT_276009 [Phyllosticta capitalensis]
MKSEMSGVKHEVGHGMRSFALWLRCWWLWWLRTEAQGAAKPVAISLCSPGPKAIFHFILLFKSTSSLCGEGHRLIVQAALSASACWLAQDTPTASSISTLPQLCQGPVPWKTCSRPSATSSDFR